MAAVGRKARSIRCRGPVPWNLMISAHARSRDPMAALALYRQMMHTPNVRPDRFTFSLLLSACARLPSLELGKLIHQHMIASGLRLDLPLRNALLHMYAACGSLCMARLTFAEIPCHDVISWNTMISAYARNRHERSALRLFRRMESAGVRPSRSTFLAALRACAGLASLPEGRAIHLRILSSGIKFDTTLGTAVVNMYGKCGSARDAWAVFDEMPRRNVITWTAMIAAYARNGCAKQALHLFRQMDTTGVKPNKLTFLSALDACCSSASLQSGRAIHRRVIADGCASDICVRNALVSMYGKCGAVEDARVVFDGTSDRNVVSWTAIIAAYAQNGHPVEALYLFGRMELEGIWPNQITILTVLDACASLASLEMGRKLHRRIAATQLDSDASVRNALMSMYSKCGSLRYTREVFDRTVERNVVSWSAMIAAYAQNGHGNEAFELLRKMESEGIKPNAITCLSILQSCSCGGLLNLGQQYFAAISSGDYDVAPSENHYACMASFLGRAGYLDEAEDLIVNMPVESSDAFWTILLGSCRIHGDLERASRVAEHAFEIDRDNATPYVALYNVLAAAGEWDNAENIRKRMEERGLKEKPGCYWAL